MSLFQEIFKKNFFIFLVVISLILAGILIWQKEIGKKIVTTFFGLPRKAILKIEPSFGTFQIGERFSFDILLDTKGENVVVGGAYLNYDPEIFEVLRIDSSNSIFNQDNPCWWEGKPCEIVNLDQTQGKIEIIKGKPTPGINTREGLIATVHLQGKKETSPSQDNFTFDFVGPYQGKSRVILDDGRGTDILSGVENARFVIRRCTPGDSCTTSLNCPGIFDSSCSCQDIPNDGCPAENLLFFDNFDDGNFDNWQIVDLNGEPYNWQVISGSLREKSDSSNSILLSPYQAEIENYKIKVKAKNTGEKNNGLGIVFGYQERNNYYRFEWYDPINDYNQVSRRIIKVENGQETTLVEDKGQAMDDNTWYDLEVLVQSGEIEVKVNNISILKTNEAPPLTRAGVWTQDNDGGIWYDDFQVESVSGLFRLRIKINLEGRTTHSTSFKLTILTREREEAIREYERNSNLQGERELEIPDLPPGNYDIRMKVPYYLSDRLNNIYLPQTTQLEFYLLAGNLRDSDNLINSLDWSIMNLQWGRTDFPPADINQDGIVNSIDWGFMNKNWAREGG